MSIKKTSEGFLVDCRSPGGQRHRRTFTTRDDARDFEFRVKYGSSTRSDKDKGIPIHEAIRKFSSIELTGGQSVERSKQYLSDLYDFLIDELELGFIHEVETIHLDQYQSILKDKEKRSELWKKIETNRKRACERSGEGYIAKVMHPKLVLPLTGNSIRRRFVVIKALFKKAKAWKWIETNPCAEVIIKSSEKATRKPWTNQNINTALELARPWAVKPFYLIAVTGMRPIGACRMTLDDLDFVNREFWVTSFKGKGGVLRRHRMVMTKDLYQFFDEVAAEVKRRPMIGPFRNNLFLSYNNTELLSTYLSEEMRRVADSMGLPDHQLYGFRHSMGAAAANPSKDGEYSGNLEIARQILGHTSISQTQDYNHTDGQLLRDQFEKLSEVRSIKLPKVSV